MSEHYDFHYQPTGSGAISGQQVLQQTEDAINELGDYVNDNVGGAMDVAQQALETAQNAEQDAQTALDTANSFSSAIQSAQQDASTALSTAQTAQTTATNANNTAIQASQDASSAVTTANNASGQVNTLSGTVTALGQRVTTAEGNIGQNTSDITALTTRVGTAEGNITTLQNDVSIAQGNASSAMATAGTVKQQSYVLRYSSTTLVASSTNSNSLLDNTDNLKVGDKVIDSSGVIYSVTAIDTANSTFTIGTALIDLAQDSDVVHKSGNETIAGYKTLSYNVTLYNSSASANPVALFLKNKKVVMGSTTDIGSQNIAFRDSADTNLSILKTSCESVGNTSFEISVYNKNSNNQTVSGGMLISQTPANTYITPTTDNAVLFGSTNRRWSKIYGTEYYYGSNNVEFSTKFVTTDTNQTISGVKTFSDNPLVGNGNTNITISNRQVTANSSYSAPTGSSYSFMQLKAIVNYVDSSPSIDATVGLSIQENAYSDGKRAGFNPNSNNTINLGLSGKRWANVYATNYYYGGSEIEFSQKFVTTDTAQTISGNKTFSNDLTVANTDTTANTPNLTLRNYKADRGTTDTAVQTISFTDKNSKALSLIESRRISNGNTGTNILTYNTDDSNNTVSGGVSIIKSKTDTSFSPNADNAVTCGRALAKWSDVVTYKVNGLNPSSLSLPSNTGYVDISSYFTNTGDGQTNSYTASVNGWIYLNVVAKKLIMQIRDSNDNVVYADMCNRSSDGTIYMTIPIGSGNKLLTQWFTSSSVTITTARFIPCQGNV